MDSSDIKNPYRRATRTLKLRVPGWAVVRWAAALAVYNRERGSSMSLAELVFVLLDEFAEDVEDRWGEGEGDESIITMSE